MRAFPLTVLAAEKVFYRGDCLSLVVPTPQGLYGVQAMHSNVISAVAPGQLKLTQPDGTETVAAVSAGLMKVEDGEVLLLVDTVERPEEIDENRARRAAAEAKEALLQKTSVRDHYMAETKMARAINRLKVKKGSSL